MADNRAMHLLVLGGTVFLGRHLVEIAAGRGHRVTMFNRGRSDIELFPEHELLLGDREREDGLSALEDGRWDAVVDLCGYVPHVVAASARLLSGRVKHYTFVSSISAHADPSTPGQDESAPVKTLPEGADATTMTAETYGALKALCEVAAREAFDGPALVVRPGLIVGPHDPSDRFTYWPRRIADGGEVLAPPADQRVQFIDVRDLADWIVRMTEARLAGLYLGTGPAQPLTMAQLVSACQATTGAQPEYAWVDEDFLLEQGVAPFTDLPLWVPEDHRGFLDVDLTAAKSAGIHYRPLTETLVDTLEWDRSRPPDTPIAAGLTRDRERELLATFHARG